LTDEIFENRAEVRGSETLFSQAHTELRQSTQVFWHFAFPYSDHFTKEAQDARTYTLYDYASIRVVPCGSSAKVINGGREFMGSQIWLLRTNLFEIETETIDLAIHCWFLEMIRLNLLIFWKNMLGKPSVEKSPSWHLQSRMPMAYRSSDRIHVQTSNLTWDFMLR